MTRTSIGADQPGDPPDPLVALREVARAKQELAEREYFHVMQARAAGISWEGVAASLGVSRQSVHRRFRGRSGERARTATRTP